MRVARLTPVEGERLRALRLASLRDAPHAFASTHEEAAARPPESWRQQLVELATFVAVADGVDVGLVRAGPFTEDAGAAMLLSMWVAPQARGAGVGDALIDAVVDWARDEGFARVVLDVGDENASAQRLYARHGFAPTGERSRLPPPREHVHEHRRARTL
ncbi:MAG: GNAT family N-acetyltransferase [Planctomycetes bacterium]|nr:GNAT family N-acetyltransferase [Planctomycetota bacterium]